MSRTIKALASIFGAALLVACWQSAPAVADSAVLERIKKEGEIRLAYRTDAAPFSYRVDDKPAGYSVNLCLEVAARLQVQLKMEKLNATFIQVTAENRFDAITQGHADLLCEATTATLSRREIMDFSIPTFISGASLVILPNGPTSFEALAGQKVGVLGGTTTQKILEATVKEHNVATEVVVVKTHDEGFDLVEKGTIAAYFGDRTILEDHLRSKKADNKLLLADSYLTIEPFALAMPIDHDFRLAVDTALSRLFRGGGMIKVFRQSFAPEAKPSDLIKMLSRTSGLPD